MTTLPPQPQRWHCQSCGEPLQFWEWQGRDILAGEPEPERLCYGCRSPLTGTLSPPWNDPNIQRLTIQRLTIDEPMRQMIGDPPGTLITWNVRKSDLAKPNIIHSMRLFMVRLDEWDVGRSQLYVPWSERGPYDVVFGALIFVLGTSTHWRLTWDWRRPDAEALCVLDNWNADQTRAKAHALMDALGAFREFAASKRGRRPLQVTEPVLREMANEYRSANNGRIPTEEELALIAGVSIETITRRVTDADYSNYPAWVQSFPPRHRG